MVPEISAKQLAEKLKNENPPQLIDVREPMEWHLAHITGAQLKPMSQFQDWFGELDKTAEYVFQCHTGYRSMQVAAYLKAQGFQNVFNLRGGITAWSVEVDPTVPRY
jgi:rhodanese-related sulfurtransferase